MKIIELRAERFKRLTAVDISPKGNVVEVCGRNGQGKSSVLDAIWLALSGSRGIKESGTTRPVKEGERDAVVRLDLGEIIVTRRWTADGKSSLSVESSSGQKFSSPQALLDTLVGNFSFDPLAFVRMAPKGQRAALLDLVKLDVDPDALDAKYKELYDERTIVNRQAKNYMAALSEIDKPASDTPDKEISVAEEIVKLNDARQAQAELARKRETLNELRETARKLKADLEKTVAQGKALAEKLAGDAFDKVDVEALEKRVLDADTINRAVREKQKYKDLCVKAETEERRSASITAEMEAIERKKREAFAAAKMPIDGLTFDDEGILFGGVPFRQCSSAEQMKVCIAIAAALNPKIRVVRVQDASLLDDASMAVVAAMADANDMQVWLERVSDDSEGGGVKIVIEDGAVRG